MLPASKSFFFLVALNPFSQNSAGHHSSEDVEEQMNREYVSLSLMGAKTRQIAVLLTTSRVWTDVVRAEVISLKRRETPGNVLLSVFEQSLETNHDVVEP